MISKKAATFYIPGKGVERVDDDGLEYDEEILFFESADDFEHWFNFSRVEEN